MDTVEQIDGYFYKGYWNLKPAELYTLIFIDVASQHLEVEAGAISAILLGQPWIPTRVKPGGTVKGTSVVSILNRKIFPNVRLPRGITLPVLVGRKISELRWAKSNQVGAIIGRWIPWIGWGVAFWYARKILMDTVEIFNTIIDPKDRIQFGYF
ncbi:STM2901 family protein [Escherichia coli]|uniref:STM2901 family protein n=1 Tax=Kosakonia cowanii TaxID=208223 RepID=UPI003B537390